MEAFGIHFLGITSENGRKLLVTVTLLAVGLLVGRALRLLSGVLFPGPRWERIDFWVRQAIRILTSGTLFLGILSIWFDDPSRLATALSLLGGGVAFGLQRLITSFAAYFVLLRGKRFNVGDRITMGGVRGDVIALDFIQTSIMEMGQPPGEQGDAPSMWVHSRQYTGRIVTVTNDQIFEKPVYNYSRDFPFVWEEMHLPLGYEQDRAAAETILLDVAQKQTSDIVARSQESFEKLEKRYLIRTLDLRPKVYVDLMPGAVKLSLRFLAEESGIRDLKDQMSRDIIRRLQQAKISLGGAKLN